MDTLRYYIVPLTTFIGVLGFLLGGPWVWLGIASFPVLMLLDALLSRDLAPRRIRSGLLADIASAAEKKLAMEANARTGWPQWVAV